MHSPLKSLCAPRARSPTKNVSPFTPTFGRLDTPKLEMRFAQKRSIEEASGSPTSYQSHLAHRRKNLPLVITPGPNRSVTGLPSIATPESTQATPVKKRSALKNNTISGLKERRRAKSHEIRTKVTIQSPFQTPLAKQRSKSLTVQPTTTNHVTFPAATPHTSTLSIPTTLYSPSPSLLPSPNPAHSNPQKNSDHARASQRPNSSEDQSDESLTFSFKPFSFQPFQFPALLMSGQNDDEQVKAIYPTPTCAYTLTKSKKLFRNDHLFMTDIASCSTCFYNVCAINEMYWEKEVEQKYTYLHSKPVFEWILEQSICFWKSGKEDTVYSRKWCFPKRYIQQISLSEEIVLILCENGKIYWAFLHETFPNAVSTDDSNPSRQWIVCPRKKSRKESKEAPNLYNKYGPTGKRATDETIRIEYTTLLATNEWKIHSMQDHVFDDEVVSIACGSNHYVALDRRGGVYCWGSFMSSFSSTYSAQVENDSPWDDESLLDPVNRDNPRKIQSLVGIPIKKIVCGSNFTFLLSRDSRLFAFGQNNSGACGFPAEVTFVEEPHQVESCFEIDRSMSSSRFCEAELNQVTKIWCGDAHTWIMRKDGRFFSAGLDTCSQVSCSNGNMKLLAGRKAVHSSLDVSHGYHNNKALYEFHEVDLSQFFDMKRKFRQVLKGLSFSKLIRMTEEGETSTSPTNKDVRQRSNTLSIGPLSPSKQQAKNRKVYRFEVACGNWSTVLCQIQVRRKPTQTQTQQA